MLISCKSLFKLLFSLSLLISIIGLNYVFGYGNSNYLEKALLLFSGIVLSLDESVKFNRLSIVGFLIITLSIFLFGALTSYTQFSWERLFSAYFSLTALLIFYCLDIESDERLFILKWIARIAPLLFCYGFLLHLIGRPMFMKDHTGALRYGGGTIPAYMAAASFASAVAYSLIFRLNNKKNNILMAFFCLILLLMSGSRMPTVCAAITVFPILFFGFKNSGQRLGIIILSAFVVVIALVTIGDDLILRFQSNSSSGRDKLWNSILVWIDYYPFTGIGFGHHSVVMPEYVKKLTGTQAVHNEYVRVTGELGYIGSILFFTGIIILFISSFKIRTTVDWVLSLLVISSFGLFSYSDNTLLSTYCSLVPLAFAMSTQIKFIPPTTYNA